MFLGSLMSIVAEEKKSGGGGGAEAPEANGDEPPADAPENEPAPPAAPTSEAPAAVPTVFDRAKALMKSKPVIQAEIRDLTARNGELSTELAEARETIRTQGEELTRLRQLETDLTATVEQLEGNQQTVAAAAADIVAQTGVPTEELPKQSAEGSDFESRHKAAMKAGPRALGQFMRENRAEVREQLRKQG